ncbi:hypothetical protein P8881_19595 [Bacillus haynesii]|uniref:hypothetical protein n=1 Tax=Bacillus haynesii TaxID=1925021 RepID=UPI00227E210D|nr:hypothetical protein [Bacillus haynesii]MCY8737541.1 hypothetical protein [Bacillus haynesii]MEC0709731.1 hypothetical protein [Bacillus haynesii]MEC0736890.1 hypothetical protein [Bacillus haynesii]
MSIQKVAANIDADIYKAIKKKVARNKFSKILRNFIINEYKPSGDLKDNEPTVKQFEVKPISLNDETLAKIDRIVDDHGKGCNRSRVLRDVLRQLSAALESDNKERYKTSEQIVHSSYYFYEGTREKLDQIMNPWERSSKIDYFLKTEYDPGQFVGDDSKIKNAEEIKIDLDILARSRLISVAQENNVSKSEVMRDVVRQLICKDTSKDVKEFKNVLIKYDQILGKEKVQSVVRDFYKSK